MLSTDRAQFIRDVANGKVAAGDGGLRPLLRELQRECDALWRLQGELAKQLRTCSRCIADLANEKESNDIANIL